MMVAPRFPRVVQFAGCAFADPGPLPMPPDFAPTELMLNGDGQRPSGFEPTVLLGEERPEPAPRGRGAEPDEAAEAAATRWFEEQEARAMLAVRRAQARQAGLQRQPAPPRAAWFCRLEAALARLLPGGLGSLLGLFVCVSMSMALLRAMLSMLDRI